MIRVLNIIGSLEMGGAETFTVNVLRNTDTEKIIYDYILYEKPTGEINYYNEVINSGSKIYYVPDKKKNILKNILMIKNIVKKNGYSIVWRHTNSCVGGFDLISAKWGGAKHLILHSHSNSCDKNERILHKILKRFVNSFVTNRFACSETAGIWMFGNKKFQVIHNGINIDKFAVNEDIRREYRKKLEIDESQLVVGHIGRFHEVKNHKFIIDVFKEIKNKQPTAVLVLIGQGKLKDEVKAYVEGKKLTDVHFMGNKNDVENWLQAFDVFIFPSLYEGLGITLIEAQTAKVPCIASDRVPIETNISNGIQYLDLNESKGKWADEVIDARNKKVELMEGIDKYDIKKEALWIQEYISEMS